jgi:hypothetical protein
LQRIIVLANEVRSKRCDLARRRQAHEVIRTSNVTPPVSRPANSITKPILRTKACRCTGTIRKRFMPHAPVEFEGTSCTLSLDEPRPGVIVMRIRGHDVGEFGTAPMDALRQYIEGQSQVELFIDARHTKGATVDVSSEWSQWLAANRSQFVRISMLTGSRLVNITADFARRFSGLQDVMRIHTDEHAFDDALEQALSGRGRQH